MNENYEIYNVLDCFKPGDKDDVIEGDKMPEYEGVLSELSFVMLRAASDYLSSLESFYGDEDKDATDIFFDLYDIWAEEKDRHEQMNRYLLAVGKNDMEEPIPNRVLDSVMSYFDGERNYDGNSYFKGLRDDKVTPEWRRLRLAQIQKHHKGGLN